MKTFRLWNDVWLDPEFRRWNIESYLPEIRCPVLVIQGRRGRVRTMAQVEAIRLQVSGPCEVLALDECRHAPHRDAAGAHARRDRGLRREARGVSSPAQTLGERGAVRILSCFPINLSNT
ncbi:MAG: alpha/beta hydrolase [Burkholderiales bacterium]|nr:alpha/beta hydrolase [Burkholderiales bacterium]